MIKTLGGSSILSSILSIFGLGQNHAQAISAKYAEATKLNVEFELILENTAEMVHSERVHLGHRITAICEHPDDEQELLSQLEPLLSQFVSEIEVGLATAKNSYKIIERSSRFSSLRKWDECLTTLHRHVAASKYQSGRVERALKQFHRVLNDADTPLIEIEEHD